MAAFCLPKKESPMRRQLDNYLNSCTKLTPEQAEMALILMLNSGKWEGLGDYPTEQQLMEVFTPKPVVLKNNDEIEAYIQAYKTGIIDSNILPQGSVNEINGKNGKKISLLARVSTSDETLRTRLNEALFYGDSEQGIQYREAYLKKDVIPNHVLEDAVIVNGSVKIQLKEKGKIKTIKVLPDSNGGILLLDADTNSIITDASYKSIQTYFKDVYKGTDLDAAFEDLTGIPRPSKFSGNFVKSPDTDIQKAKTGIKTEIIKYRNNDGTLTAEGKKLFTQLFEAEALPEGTTNAVLDNGQLVLNIHRRDNHTGDLADFRAVVDFSSNTPRIKLTLNGNSVNVNSSNHMEIAAMIKNKFSRIEGSITDYLAKHGVQSNDNLKKPVGALDTIKAIMQKQRIDIEKTEIGAVKLGDRIYDKLPENYEYSVCQNVFPKTGNLGISPENIEKGKITVDDVISDTVSNFKIIRANLNHEDALKPYSHNSRYFVKYQGRYFDVTKAIADVRDSVDYTSEHLQNAIISEVNSAITALNDSKSLSDWAKRTEISNKELSDQAVSEKSDSPTIVSQLNTHLKSMGIEVHGKKDMEEFLKNHDPQELQKMEEQREMEEIKQKAIADGTFMKAPNGKKSNLTEKQWLQTRTKNFKNWFGDWQNDPDNASKVVDENGEPLVVYHGTRTGEAIRQEGFSKKMSGKGNRGADNQQFYFTSSPENAKYTGINDKNILPLIDTIASVYDLFGTSDIPSSNDLYKLADSYHRKLIEVKDALHNVKDDSPAKKIVNKLLSVFNIKNQTSKELKEDLGKVIDSINKDIEEVRRKAEVASNFKLGLQYLSGDRSKTSVNTFRFIKETKNADSPHRQAAANKLINILYGTDNLVYSPEVFPVFLNIRQPQRSDYNMRKDEENPLLLGKYNDKFIEYNKKEAELLNDLKSSQYDGAISKNKFDVLFGDVYIVKEPNQIKSATENNGDFSTTDDRIQAAWSKKEEKRTIFNKDLLPSEKNAIQHFIETLSSDTDTSRGLYFYNEDTKQVYKFDTSLNQYKENRLDGGDGFEIKDILETNKLNKEHLEEIEDGFKENKTNFDSWLKDAGYEKRTSNGRHELVKNGRTVDNHDGLDSNSLSRESDRGQSDTGGQKHQQWSEVKRDSATGRISFVEGDGRTIDEIEKFQTPQGELYGFVDKDGKMYLDETVISPEHPIHEYTHLWDRAVRKRNPELWKSGRFHNTIDNKGRISYLCQGTKFGWL